MARPSFDDNGVQQPQGMRWDKTCRNCQESFQSNRDDAQTCSTRCRTALHRRERRERIGSQVVVTEDAQVLVTEDEGDELAAILDSAREGALDAIRRLRELTLRTP